MTDIDSAISLTTLCRVTQECWAVAQEASDRGHNVSLIAQDAADRARVALLAAIRASDSLGADCDGDPLALASLNFARMALDKVQDLIGVEGKEIPEDKGPLIRLAMNRAADACRSATLITVALFHDDENS